MGSQRVGHDWATDLIWSDIINSFTVFHCMESLMYLIHFSSYWTCWLFATVLLLHQGCKGHPPAKSWHVTFTTSSGQIPWRVAAGGGAPSPLPPHSCSSPHAARPAGPWEGPRVTTLGAELSRAPARPPRRAQSQAQLCTHDMERSVPVKTLSVDFRVYLFIL